jgi:hypothetical protein
VIDVPAMVPPVSSPLRFVLVAPAAAALRLAMLAVPAVQALKEILQDKSHPQRMRAVTEVLDRNGLNAVGKPEPTPATFVPPTQQTTFNMSSVKFNELSDEGLDLVGRC